MSPGTPALPRRAILASFATLALLAAAAAPAASASVAGATRAAVTASPADIVQSTTPDTAPHIAVTLSEMSIKTGWAIAPAGTVVFDITNTGTVTHELVVIRSDAAPAALTRDPANASKASETGSVGEADDIAPGQSASLRLTLGYGSYVLICNEPGHYAAGMRAAFTVEQAIVNVRLNEMSIQLSQAIVPAGPVFFHINNTGTVTHELVFLKTSAAPDSLPLDKDKRAIEDTSVGEIDDVVAADFSGGLLNLAAGDYVLICNEPGHYLAGMRIRFTVTPSVVNATLKEMAIQLDATTLAAGPMTFLVKNTGTVTHELVVIRTDKLDGSLPAGDEAGKVSEAGWMGETGDLDPGQSASLPLTLNPGTYAIICNEPGHYAAGMHLIFTVR